jgi:2-hydroxychromene-2-carboxylate isomerase
MSEPAIDFWYFIGSTYTYLTLMRLAEIEASTGLRFRHRPFNVRAIMREMDNIPFSTKPIKAQYMWRDIERRTQMYGIPFRRPPAYPLKNPDLANRVAIVGDQEGWCATYARATYRRWFLDDQEPGSEPNLSDSLAEIGQDPARVLELAASDAIGAAYDAQTETARRLRIFGSPTFAVGDEIFWGDDRLDDAIRWRRRGTLSPAGVP